MGLVFSFAHFHLARAHFRDLVIDQLDSHFHRLRGRALQVGIECRIDAIGLIVQLVLVELVDQRIAHQVDVVRSITGFDVRRRQLERRGFGLVRFRPGNRVRVGHSVQHDIAAIQRALGMAVRRKITGRLNQPGQQCRLRQRDVLEIFVEIGFRCLCESADGERSPLSQVNPVCVKLENLLLAELLLEFERNHDFRQLPLDRLLRREEKCPRKLHGDGRTALLVALPGYVNPEGLCQTQKIHAPMLEKAPVFDGEHGIDHHFRILVVFHQLPLRALFGIEQCGHQLRFQFVG